MRLFVCGIVSVLLGRTAFRNIMLSHEVASVPSDVRGLVLEDEPEAMNAADATRFRGFVARYKYYSKIEWISILAQEVAQVEWLKGITGKGFRPGQGFHPLRILYHAVRCWHPSGNKSKLHATH